jgi:hypothetical protein
MAIMRTNRLASKTTTPPRKLTSASELEAQDAAYKKYQGDLSSYESKMKEYNPNMGKNRKYTEFVGGKAAMRKLNPTEEAQFNKVYQSNHPGSNTFTNIEVPKSSKNIYDPSGFHGSMVKPTAPSKVSPADWSTVQLDKMPTKKAEITTKKGKLRTNPAPVEKADFEYPSANVSKMGTKTAKTGGGKSGLVRAKGQGDLGAARAGVIKTKSPAGYNREKSQFEAFAAAGGDQTKAMFKAEAKTSKGLAKQYKAEGNAEGTEMMRQEAKQYKKAAQFAGKLAKGNNKFFERDMVSSFRDSKQNAANRNTIEAKITAAGKSANRNTLY